MRNTGTPANSWWRAIPTFPKASAWLFLSWEGTDQIRIYIYMIWENPWIFWIMEKVLELHAWKVDSLNHKQMNSILKASGTSLDNQKIGNRITSIWFIWCHLARPCTVLIPWKFLKVLKLFSKILYKPWQRSIIQVVVFHKNQTKK